MNSEESLRLIRKQFQSAAEVGPEIVRAERREGSAPIGIYYFDFSESVRQPQFNLSTFVQKWIATDFYKHEGSLQWNYYIYFLLSPEQFHLVSATRISEVESDRTFARKYVRDTVVFNSELASPLGEELRSSKLGQDIASQWVEALTEGGLSGIADPQAEYAPTIRRYFEQTGSRAPAATHDTTSVDAERGLFVERLKLEKFRQHPAKRDFEFGRVNLFRGSNGTGKTSVLEAIELAICGGNRRQEGAVPSGTHLRALYKGGSEYQVSPQKSAKIYRDRDRSWYGGYYLQGNRLFDNFARFNFFDTDAATQLSAESSNEELQAAINSLFLGQFATSIEERMRQALERFRRELQVSQRDLKTHKETRRKVVDDLTRIRGIKDTRETLSKELQAAAKECSWKRVSSTLTVSAMAALRESAAREVEVFAGSAKRVNWIAPASLRSLLKDNEVLARAGATAEERKESLETIREKIERKQSQEAEIKAQLEILRRLRAYHDEPGALELRGASETIASLKGTVKQWQEATLLTKALKPVDFEENRESLNSFVKSRLEEVTQQTRSVARLKSRLSTLQDQFGRIKSVVEQIRGLGRHFCEESPDAKMCPLCGAAYIDLRSQLESLPNLESPVSELSSQIAREENLLGRSQSSLEAAQRLKRANALLNPDRASESETVKKVWAQFVQLPEKLASQKLSLETLAASEKHLRQKGFTESEWNELLESARENELPRSKIQKLDSVRDLYEQKSADVRELRSEIKLLATEESSIKAALRDLYVQTLGKHFGEEAGIEIARRRGVIEDVLQIMRSPKRPLVVGDSDDFTNMAASVGRFVQSLDRIATALMKIEEKDSLESSLSAQLKESEQAIKPLELRERLAREAVNLLSKLLGSDYKESYLREVGNQHRERLVTLFTRIHSPNEFVDLRFDKTLQLQRTGGSMSSVSEISTGQRAALAISIFLSLNSSVSARAPWLLFDDPVAHVDDLNVLSFLDILRDLVLLGDRQVFFATANPRIGDLFARKFDWMGEQFREFRLSR